MKFYVAHALLLAGVVHAASRSIHEEAKAPANPVSRIVTLLRGLQDKLETDLKAETDLFETYKCWAKSTTSTKTASNEAANSRIDSLKTYISDIEAGKIEFTTERVDLEKQVAELSDDLEKAKTMRESEKADFEAAKKEMEMAISALDEAITVMDDATKGSFAQKRSYLGMLSQKHSVRRALQFTQGLLEASDAKYLENLLLNGPENPDWKKLNRKADFKMKYTKRSGKIQKTLASLKTTFETNLEEAEAKEKQAVEDYEKLKKSKEGMLDTAQKALTDMVAETGARGLNKEQAQDEVDALTDQVDADTKFIKETEDSFKIKEGEWTARKELREKEILAMSQAIAVLASDDAKDAFKESYSSQGYLFLQESQVSVESARAKALRVVQSLVAKAPQDGRLVLLQAAAGNEQIKKVIEKIDDIIVVMKDEEKEDLTKKEKCESDLADAASKSRLAALAMDTASEDIARAKQKVSELKDQIEEQETKKKGLEGQVKDITRQREDENAQFKADKLADQQAADLVELAIKKIKEWKTAKASLLSKKKQLALAVGAMHEAKGLPPTSGVPTPPSGILPPPAASSNAAGNAPAPKRLAAAAIRVHTAARQDPQYAVEAGTAPVPPPPTWESAEYTGAESEQGGIIGIMEIVKEDIEKDISSGEKEEADSVKAFEKEKQDLEDEIEATKTAIDDLMQDKAGQEKIGTDKTKERATKKGELEGQVKLYKEYKPGCDFLLVNFEVRTKKRQAEMDGLTEAKAILQGADFS